MIKNKKELIKENNKMKTKKQLIKEKEKISPCLKCHCMTKSIRLGRANYICGKCNADKSLSDLYFYELTNQGKIKN